MGLDQFHPDNAHIVDDYLRNHVDIVLSGHEHCIESQKSIGNNWSIEYIQGKELQGSNTQDSAFSVYVFPDSFDKIKSIVFSWTKGCAYERITDEDRTFQRNIHSYQQNLVPNSSTFDKIDDPGFVIQHFRKADVLLSDVYCWPELEIVDLKKKASSYNVRVRDNIPNYILNIPFVIITGQSLYGKSALARMLYKQYIACKKCCVIFDATNLTSFKMDAIVKGIENRFSEQYSYDQIEQFRQKPLDDKILIIDNFESIAFSEEKRNIFLNCISDLFGHIIVFSAVEFFLPVAWKNEDKSIENEFMYFRILPMGNYKRMEFISKWYQIGENEVGEESEL